MNDIYDLKLVLTTFTIYPYDILILQDSYGKLITIKTLRDDRIW